MGSIPPASPLQAVRPSRTPLRNPVQPRPRTAVKASRKTIFPPNCPSLPSTTCPDAGKGRLEPVLWRVSAGSEPSAFSRLREEV
jgi:hypothetical protein